MPHYQPATAWTCRSDAEPGDYFCHNIQCCDLSAAAHDWAPWDSEVDTKILRPKFAILGFASDLGVQRNLGRVGAKLAPALIRKFLSRLSIPYLEPTYDCGDIVVDESLLAGQQLLAAKVALLVKAKITPLVLGGGHETAYGHYLGLMHGLAAPIAILNFDAHFDLRPVSDTNEGNSGTPFRQIYNHLAPQDFNYYCIGIQPRANTRSLYAFAAASGTKFIEAAAVIKFPHRVLELVAEIIARHKYIYVTLCLDVFHYSFAPGVSAPQALGISPQIVIEALQLLKKSQQVCGLDVVELNPNLDIDNHTARLAANLISEFYYG